MNSTSRAILQTVLSTDPSLSDLERVTVQRLINGKLDVTAGHSDVDRDFFVSQKRAAELLSVSRTTIWRMTKEGALHPIEVVPGTWRYRYRALVELGRQSGSDVTREEQRQPTAA